MEFKTGDLVWAKLDDFPYWPGRVANECITEELKEFRGTDGIGILFFGFVLTYGLVSKENVKSFEENYDTYSKLKKADKNFKLEFEEALKQAKSKDVIEDPPLELDEDKRETAKKAKTIKSENNNENETKTEEKNDSEVTEGKENIQITESKDDIEITKIEETPQTLNANENEKKEKTEQTENEENIKCSNN